MNNLKKEVEANFGKFSGGWKTELQRVITELDKEDQKFGSSYAHLTSFQAWRTEILSKCLPEDSLAFFAEAQNDALVSHVFARMGAWRSALKSLRSCLENVCYCLYYKDHPIELRLWLQGSHRLPFATLHEYFEHHPDVSVINDKTVTGLDTIKAEFATLSRAVHASAKGFRMTTDAKTMALWSSEKASLGAWLTRESHVVTGLNLLLLCVFRSQLTGAQLLNLRKAISLTVPKSRFTAIKSSLGISLISS